MSHDPKPREFLVTRTTDNSQLGLSVLIESLKPGETKIFIEKSAYDEQTIMLNAITNINQAHIGEIKSLRADLAVAIEALESCKHIECIAPHFSFKCQCPRCKTLARLTKKDEQK